MDATLFVIFLSLFTSGVEFESTARTAPRGGNGISTSQSFLKRRCSDSAFDCARAVVFDALIVITRVRRMSSDYIEDLGSTRSVEECLQFTRLCQNTIGHGH